VFDSKVNETARSGLGNGGGVFDEAVAESGGVQGERGYSGGGGAIAVGERVSGVTRGFGDGGGERNGHEAETFPLQVLHGGSHVFLHQLRHLLLRRRQGVV